MNIEQTLKEHQEYLESFGAEGKKADLQWADLQGANLGWADLEWADLRGVDLQGANLHGANLGWASLQGANLLETGLVVYQRDKWTAYIQKEYIRIGCQYHSAQDWWSFDDATITSMDAGALDYWRTNRAIIHAIWESL